MNNNLLGNIPQNSILGVAVSGGSDSMALLHYAVHHSKRLQLNIIAINVEHGIRGTTSLRDSKFVKDYCDRREIPLLEYSVNATKYAKENKLSIEQAARILRYDCFLSAIKSGKCHFVATAHHSLDNLESVLFNLFRGTGIKGVAGINDSREDKIIRPFLRVSKAEIEEYIKENSIPYTIDETNLSDDYTRNFIRHNVIPSIKRIFPDVENSVSRFCQVAKLDDEFLESLANKSVNFDGEKISLTLPLEKPILSRAIIHALKLLGVKKDWEKSHVDAVIDLSCNQSGKKVTLLNGISAVKEYDRIVLTKLKAKDDSTIKFAEGTFAFLGKTLKITKLKNENLDLKNGLYLASEKVPKSAIIRARNGCDTFTKFGGGTKSLSDYFTDKKILPTERDFIPIIASGNKVLGIFGVAISSDVKVEISTNEVYKIEIL